MSEQRASKAYKTWMQLTEAERIQALETYLANKPSIQIDTPEALSSQLTTVVASAGPLESRQPVFITAPATLQAILTFEPFVEAKRVRKKVKRNENTPVYITSNKRARTNKKVSPFTYIFEDKLVEYIGVPSLNDYIEEERKRGGFAGREFVRRYREHANNITSEYFSAKGAQPLNLKWTQVVVVSHLHNFRTRDVHNAYLKAVFDGMTDAHLWQDDRYLIDLRLVTAGVDSDTPRHEIFVYSLALTVEQELKIQGWDAWNRENPEKVAAFSHLKPKKSRKKAA